MKAAVVYEAGKSPVFADFEAPAAKAGEELITVKAAALTHFTKARASGAHYSASASLPAIAGSDGVGVTQDGRRVYFILPGAPFGAMAEVTRVRAGHCIPVPEGIDDIAAAALANPGMSAWAALVHRAQLKQGDTVIINGATGIAGRLAVQLAKHLGAGKVIATARDEAALASVKALGADVVIPMHLDGTGPDGSSRFEEAIREQCKEGVDVVVDYLWGKSAQTIIAAVAKTVEDARPVRFVQVGSSSGADITLPSAALRSSAIVLMGSGIKSVPLPDLLAAVGHVFAAAVPANLRTATRVLPLSDVQTAWDHDGGKARVVFVPT
nr:zinc-binding alcohol dehydrogenase family protein [Luteibacter rhizovicinus]